jgi:hypothetical protein
VENWGRAQRKKKGAKKKENGGLWKLTPLMEIRSQTRIPTAAWKAQNAFHSSHKARRRFYRLDSPAGRGQIKRSKGAKSS